MDGRFGRSRDIRPARLESPVTPARQDSPLLQADLGHLVLPGTLGRQRVATLAIRVAMEIPVTLATPAIRRPVTLATPADQRAATPDILVIQVAQVIPVTRGIQVRERAATPDILVNQRPATLVTPETRRLDIPGIPETRLLGIPDTPPTLVHLAPLVSLGAEAEVPRRRCTCCLPDSHVRDTRGHPQTNRAATS